MSSNSASLKFVLDEGDFIINEQDLNKKMGAFQTSINLTTVIKSKLAIENVGRIRIEFIPIPNSGELVKSWLERANGQGQIVVQLGNTVYESMLKQANERASVTTGLQLSNMLPIGLVFKFKISFGGSFV